MIAPAIRFPVPPPAAAIALLALAGCAAPPADLGRGEVDALTAARGQPPAADAEAHALPAWLAREPLSAARAARAAVAGRPELHAAYAALARAAADVSDAGRIRNPILSADLFAPDRAGERDEVAVGFAVSLADLLTLSARSRRAEAEFAAVRQETADRALAVAAAAQTAYFRRAAARQRLALERRAAHAAELAAELAARYQAAGNLPARELEQYCAQAAEARLALLEAEAQAASARLELARAMGVSAAGAWNAPARLPLPAALEPALPGWLERARRDRLDLAAAAGRAAALAKRLDWIEEEHPLGEIELGLARERESDGTHLDGVELEWEVPVFRADGRRLRAAAALREARAAQTRLELALEHEVRAAYAAAANAAARAAVHRYRLRPALAGISARERERTDYMLASVFDRFAALAREHAAQRGHLAAVRDYWLARVALARATGGVLPADAEPAARLTLEPLAPPPPAGEAP